MTSGDQKRVFSLINIVIDYRSYRWKKIVKKKK